ncbi:hypothetical protein AZE42_13075 [Rhizopogon vesiculosus]|uniref:Uncharacterized protein n=1 Tax=Rhizopogon vesiculosus TaxID=180088 RepID=A0A1J8Q8S4_9AGAM|nr:hypothetical protein AZE42_13075 [Rhizopogon vesiculosus]
MPMEELISLAGDAGAGGISFGFWGLFVGRSSPEVGSSRTVALHL